jgi:tRNA A37 N6-isopentenylltransferase MiaA
MSCDEFQILQNIDDSYIRDKDKQGLIHNIELLYKNKFTWADDVLLASIVEIEYKRHIQSMDKEKYLDEISNKSDVTKYMKTKKQTADIKYYIDPLTSELPEMLK